MKPSELFKQANEMCDEAENKNLSWKESKAIFKAAEALEETANKYEVIWKEKAHLELTAEQIDNCDENAGDMIAAGSASQEDSYYWACETAACEYDWDYKKYF